MAIIPFFNQVNPLPKFAQSSLAPAPGGGVFAHFKPQPNPLPKFAQSSLAPGPGGAHMRPVHPLPLTGSSTVGTPI